jgi:flagellin-like protein
LKLSGHKKRRGLAEIVGTLIMVAITLVAGAGVFGWINGQAGSSENAYGQSVANNVNFLKERFVPVSQTFTGAGAGNSCSGGTSPNFQCTGVNFWIYNNGQVAFTLYTIQIRNLTNIPLSAANHNPLNILFYSVCTVSSSTCGFEAYNKAGTSTVCSSNAALPTQNGFFQGPGVSVPAVLAQNTLSPNAYQITMPTGITCSAGAQYLFDGIVYTVTFSGLYGNTFQTTLTVNG